MKRKYWLSEEKVNEIMAEIEMKAEEEISEMRNETLSMKWKYQPHMKKETYEEIVKTWEK